MLPRRKTSRHAPPRNFDTREWDALHKVSSDLEVSIKKPVENNWGTYLVGGFNPFEKYSSNWIISPRIRVENKKYLSCHHLEHGL